jgi:hypothetical protein
MALITLKLLPVLAFFSIHFSYDIGLDPLLVRSEHAAFCSNARFI